MSLFDPRIYTYIAGYTARREGPELGFSPEPELLPFRGGPDPAGRPPPPPKPGGGAIWGGLTGLTRFLGFDPIPGLEALLEPPPHFPPTWSDS